MPRLWSQTIQTHRQEVGDAILETTAALVAEHGLRGVTMSRIAEETGIGRATLYKYFPDIEAILVAWHERHAAARLAHLAELRDQAADPGLALEAVLHAIATHLHHEGMHGRRTDLVALVHKDEHVRRIEQQLDQFLRGVLAQAAKTGHVRTDVPADELANYCLHALAGASQAPSKTAAKRLVDLTLAGLEPA